MTLTNSTEKLGVDEVIPASDNWLTRIILWWHAQDAAPTEAAGKDPHDIQAFEDLNWTQMW